MKIKIPITVVFLLLTYAPFLHSEESVSAMMEAPEVKVFVADEPPVLISDLKLDFSFRGMGVYYPRDYPTLTSIPLINGMMVDFDKIAEVTFMEKQEETNEKNDTFLKVDLLAIDGTRVKSVLKEPSRASVNLIGKSALGSFKQDLYAGKVRLQFGETSSENKLAEMKSEIERLTTQEKKELYKWLIKNMEVEE